MTRTTGILAVAVTAIAQLFAASGRARAADCSPLDPPDCNAAEFVSQSVPLLLHTGELAEVAVTMKNTGNSTWSESTNHRLGSFPQDNLTWGLNRVELGDGEVVQPGEQHTFTFQVAAPTAPGTHTFQWQMVQDLVGWFDDVTPAQPVTVEIGPPRYLSPDGVTFPAQRQTVKLQWSPVPAAASYTLAVKDLIGGGTTTVSGLTGLARVIHVLAGHSYQWTVTSIDAAADAGPPSVAASFAVRPDVPDVTPPTVSVARPLAGAQVSGSILVSALASDDVRVQRVELSTDGVTPALTLVHSPYLFYWSSATVGDGPRTLTLKAYDAAGNAASATVAVTVDNSEAGPCIPPGSGPLGDEVAINAALAGPGAVALLCPGATYHLHDRVVFSAVDQDLHTQGFPTGPTRATLDVDGGATGGAINATNVTGVKIRNLRVDGHAGTLPQQVGKALIRLGGDAQDQLVAAVRAFDTSTWSTVHVFEGSPDPQVGCNRALVILNDLGPAGYPGQPGDGTWADGISLACRNSRVVRNRITDATDGGIVVFSSPGSLVEGNRVIAATRAALGGINMVDYEVFEGDYRGTVVAGNTIAATGAPIHIALGMGWNTMNCVYDDEHRNVGGTVVDNVLTGGHMHYGFVANGVWDWTVRGNVSLAVHSGVPPSPCSGLPAPSPPAAFLKDALRAGGNLQPELVDGNVDAVLWVHD